jgi:hypothetical protein
MLAPVIDEPRQTRANYRHNLESRTYDALVSNIRG